MPENAHTSVGMWNEYTASKLAVALSHHHFLHGLSRFSVKVRQLAVLRLNLGNNNGSADMENVRDDRRFPF